MRLELSSDGRYAIRALLYLARAARRVPADGIAAEAGIPRRLLARLLARLARAGLVESIPGPGGGCRLRRPAASISLAAAVSAAEGPFGLTRCIVQDRACGSGGPCVLHDAWEEGQRALFGALERRTLAEFAGQAPPDP